MIEGTRQYFQREYETAKTDDYKEFCSHMIEICTRLESLEGGFVKVDK